MSKIGNSVNRLHTQGRIVSRQTLSAVDLFSEAIRSPESRKVYLRSITQFQKETGFTLHREATNAKGLQDALIAWTVRAKSEGKSYSRILGMMSAVFKYASVYDVEIKEKKIRGFLPENTKIVQDRIYSREEIRTLLESCRPREKAIILLLISTGARVGALPTLKVKHLTRLNDGRYKVLLYAGAIGEEVITFLTLEASQALERYFKERRISGEEITPDSPVIRNADNHKPLSNYGIRNVIQLLTVKSGLRKVGDGKRQEVMLLHNFRKLNNTELVRAGVKQIVIELLLGHSVGLQRNYLRLSDDELYAEFLKAEQGLTISEESALRGQLEKAVVDRETVDELKDRIKALEAEKHGLVQDIGKEQMDREFEQEQVVKRLERIHSENVAPTLEAMQGLLQTVKRLEEKIKKLERR
jgi:integrase